MSLDVGASKALTATVTPADAVQTVTFTSSDTKIATVNASGTVTAVGAGSADITATTVNSLTAVCKVTVKAVEPPVEG